MLLLLHTTGGFASKNNLNTHRFVPALGVRGFLVTESGDLTRHLKWNAGLFFDYSYKALVEIDADNKGLLRTLVRHRTVASLSAAIGLFDWVELGVSFPLVLSQEGATIAGDKLKRFTFGDLRFSTKIALLQSWKYPVGLSVRLSADFPTAEANNLVGEKNTTLRGSLNLSYTYRGMMLATNVGVTVRTHPQTVFGVRFGNELNLNLALGYHFRKVGVTLFSEGLATTRLDKPLRIAEETPIEVIVGLRWAVWKVHILAAGALGVHRGAGTPAARAILGVMFSTDIADRDQDGIPDDRDRCPDDPEDKDGFEDQDGCPDPDNDKDGICDPWVAAKGLSKKYAHICRGSDRCPNEPEDKDGFEDDDGCPDPDNDKDGICDPWVAATGQSKKYAHICRGIDLCPNEPEDKDGFQDDDGCPDLDNDGDGIPDVQDKCPLMPEDHDGFEDQDGCPDLDNDKDGIPDLKDLCPNQAETRNGFQDDDGCPDQLAELFKNQIKIYQKIYFEVARSDVSPRSYPLLAYVAGILKAHPEILHVRIEGHTDRKGKYFYNKWLSKWRAKAVFRHLVNTHGIDKKRLSYEGFGYKRPLVSGEDPDALAKNRRVEFVITKRTLPR